MNIIFLYFNVVLLINESRSTISILLIGNKITVVKSKYDEQGQGRMIFEQNMAQNSLFAIEYLALVKLFRANGNFNIARI